MEESRLIEKIIAGEKLAFSELVNAYKNKVYNTALGYLQNPEDAEDIAQEVFIEIFRSIETFKGESSLSTWIYRISVTKSLELIRKRKRKKRFAIVKDIFSGSNENFEPVDFIHPGIIMENKERSALLFKKINRLPDKQKTAFILNKVEGLSYKEISKIMNLSQSAVESIIFRAKENLKKYLKL
ncbi:RNA polymerase sigma factor, partial [bacterium]